MSFDYPRYTTYLERLLPDSKGKPTPIEVEQPQSRDDAFDLYATINRLAVDDVTSWKWTFRQYTATNWYMLGLFLSGGQRLDIFTGRPEMDCDFLWHHYHEMQHQGSNVLNKSFRGSHKTHIRFYVGTTNKVLLDPNRVIARAAHDKMTAARSGHRCMLEWENNIHLKIGWDDVFFWDPKRDPECPIWNQDTGCTVKRTISAVLPTLSWYAIEGVPTGARVSDFELDDLETEDTVETDGQREKLLKRFSSFKKLAGRMPTTEINGTNHHPNGLIAHIERSEMYRVVCHTAEDLTQDPPDIATLFDECGGKIVDRESGEVRILPPAVRDIKLDGAPVFHHPLELALMRLEAQLTPTGLADYYTQMMGDAMAGQERKFDKGWIRYYDRSPIDVATDAFLYFVIDASKGGDRTFARVEATLSDGTIAWVGGLRKRIAPSDFGREIWMLGCQWEGIGTIKEFRFEEVAQSTWADHFEAYCRDRRHWPGNIGPENVKRVPARAEIWGGGGGQKRLREWNRLQPAYKNGKRLFPKEGVLLVEDEKGRRFDLMAYYRDRELGLYPTPDADDGLDSECLLFAPTDEKRGIGPIEFPESHEAVLMRQMAEYRNQRRSGGAWGGRGDDDGSDRSSWMNEGL